MDYGGARMRTGCGAWLTRRVGDFGRALTGDGAAARRAFDSSFA